MKLNILLIPVMVFNMLNADAQDTIILKKNNEIIIADIIKITDTKVTYILADSEVYSHTLDRNKIANIKFQFRPKDVSIRAQMNPKLRAGIGLTVVGPACMIVSPFIFILGAAITIDQPGSAKGIGLAAGGGVCFFLGTIATIAGPILIVKGKKELKASQQQDRAYFMLPTLNLNCAKSGGIGFQINTQFHF